MQQEDRRMKQALAGMEPSTASLMEFSQTVQTWLETTVADPGTHVDAGFGEGGRDLWVTVGGKEFLVRLSLLSKSPGAGKAET